MPDTDTDQIETEAARAARLEYERAAIEEGLADIREGRFLTGPELDAWLDRLVEGLPPESPVEGEP